MDDLLYPQRSIHHLDFSPIKGIFCIQLYIYIFPDRSRNEKSFEMCTVLITSVMRSLFKKS